MICETCGQKITQEDSTINRADNDFKTEHLDCGLKKIDTKNP